jgi:transcriptional regulator with XRE-family HTH domain
MNEIEVLASNVRRIRLSKGLTQPQLAGAANVSLSAFKRLEGANETPSMRTVQAVAKALEVPLRDLFSPVKQLHAVRFRSRKKLRLRENILADVSRWISDFNELEAFLNEAKPFACWGSNPTSPSTISPALWRAPA